MRGLRAARQLQRSLAQVPGPEGRHCLPCARPALHLRVLLCSLLRVELKYRATGPGLQPPLRRRLPPPPLRRQLPAAAVDLE